MLDMGSVPDSAAALAINRPVNHLRRMKVSALFGCLLASLHASTAAVAPYDFPYGYPFPDYPLAGASHPRVSNDYMKAEPRADMELKRIGQYALRLIQTERAAGAIEYADQYRSAYPGRMDQEVLFMRSMAQAQLGQLDAAARSMTMAIDEAGIPPQRFLAGPRRLFAPLHGHQAFTEMRQRWSGELVHGPMLGAMTDRSVRVWVRGVDETKVRVVASTSADLSNPIASAWMPIRAQDDYTAEMALENLRPDTLYYYAVQLGEEARVLRGKQQQFRTYPSAGTSSKLRVVFGGCSGYVPPNERMWDTIQTFSPSAFLTLGDNVYIDDPESPDQQRYCYYQRQSRPEYRRLVAGTPVYAIWDDHDFAMDDSIGGSEPDVPYWKPMVSEIFRQNWVNPAYGGGDEHRGIWFDFRVGDAHFIMLDSRTYRTDPGRFGNNGGVEKPTMLGPAQLEWLRRTLLGSDAKFKLLVSPVSWHEASKTGAQGLDSWAGFLPEREAIFSWIRDHRVSGMVLLSSDRHRSDAWLNKRSDSYDLYEFSSGQFTNQHTHRVMEGSLFGYNTLPSFGLLTFDTKAEDPSITYEIVNIDGEIKNSLTVRLSQLGKPAP